MTRHPLSRNCDAESSLHKPSSSEYAKRNVASGSRIRSTVRQSHHDPGLQIPRYNNPPGPPHLIMLPCFIKSLPTEYSTIALQIQAINLVISITIRVPGLLSSKCPAVFSYTNITMFQCTNQPRGCRGRCNTLGGKCKDCSSLRLKHGHRPVQYQSKLAQPVNYQRSLASIYSDDTRQPQQT